MMQASASFDQSVGSLHAPLISGGCVRLTDLRTLAETAVSEPGFRRATFMKGTPSHLALLTTMPEDVSPSGTITLGGEELRGEVLAPWRATVPDVTVVNVYGPTEATGHCLEHWIDPGRPVPPGPVPIGTPHEGCGCTSSTRRCGRSRRASTARCTWRACSWRAATWAGAA
ncbi:hypothetical protein D3C59_27835 [Streptomyces sp. SHP22-7]|nr:hypothetical protein D3C59_27835 [Streptomyces sp. SHP22-7]